MPNACVFTWPVPPRQRWLRPRRLPRQGQHPRTTFEWPHEKRWEKKIETIISKFKHEFSKKKIYVNSLAELYTLNEDTNTNLHAFAKSFGT